ncbi:MAG: hypothetical protein WCO55_01360 [Candidatus Falkowbacteria bacterium]
MDLTPAPVQLVTGQMVDAMDRMMPTLGLIYHCRATDQHPSGGWVAEVSMSLPFKPNGKVVIRYDSLWQQWVVIDYL